MITKEQVARLAAIHSDHGIVSVYIKIDPRLIYDRGQPATKFKGAFSRARRSADEWQTKALEREHDRILSFLETWQQKGAGLAIFACQPADLWEVVELNVSVPTYVSVADEPDAGYLIRVLDEAPRMAVVLLDGGDARLYLSEQGVQQEALKHSEDLPNRHDQGGWSQARFQRHVEFHHSHLLREVADQVSDIFYKKGFDRLVVVGVDEATKEFAGLLSDPLRERVIGHLTADFKTENDTHILQRAGQLAQEQERSAEVALVDQIAEYADAHGRGTLGLDDTLPALFEGKADTIVVASDLTAEGSHCYNCVYFSAHKFKKCPICTSGNCEDVADVVDHAIDYALLNGTHVNVVFGPAADLLIARGGIGALLRYVVPAPAES